MRVSPRHGTAGYQGTGAPTPFALAPIGFVERPPSQWRLRSLDELRSHPAMVVLLARYRPGLAGLRHGSYAWILWVAHLALGKPWQPLVRPRGDPSARPRGVFATRSPVRPNPVMMSLVKVVELEPRGILVLGLDAVHGTPVVDVKPYSPSLDDPRQLERLKGGDEPRDYGR